jgi:hypothetical protein
MGSMFETLMAAVVVTALSMLGLGLGVFLRGRALQGTCSRLANEACHCGPARRLACRRGKPS